ncbi:MAG: hypothetical protein Q7V05_02825 [Methanoregula sp.]|nr:hypothetical protein [Methanoregula sp.]
MRLVLRYRSWGIDTGVAAGLMGGCHCRVILREIGDVPDARGGVRGGAGETVVFGSGSLYVAFDPGIPGIN